MVRTAEYVYTSECFTSVSMQVLITYLPYQTFSPLMMRSSHKDISRAGFENNFNMEAIFGEIIYV